MSLFKWRSEGGRADRPDANQDGTAKMEILRRRRHEQNVGICCETLEARGSRAGEEKG